jgi:hypothetical protein
MSPKRVFSVDELEDIKSQYLSGTALWKIGEVYGVSRIVITRVVRELGIYQDKRTSMSVEEHKERLRRIGKVELVGDWVNTQTKTLYYCIEHRENHFAYPNNVLRGHGLVCCTKAGQELARIRLIDQTASTYDERIREVSNGYITRIGDYVSSKTPILHHCSRHNEEHMSRPGNILSGYGLRCCLVAWSLEQAVARNSSAKNRYDASLQDRSDGRFRRIDEYIDATTPILHYCSVHGEEHLAIPNKLLNGDGMKCCNTGVGWDTLENLLENKPVHVDSDIDDPCQFYIFQVPSTDDCVKIGIAKSALRRSRVSSSRDLYGDLVSVWQCSTRRNAILIETAVLRDPSFEHPTLLVDTLVDKAGQSEVRRVDIDTLVDHVQDLFDSLEQRGSSWASWALERIPLLRNWEQKVLRGLVD